MRSGGRPTTARKPATDTLLILLPGSPTGPSPAATRQPRRSGGPRGSLALPPLLRDRGRDRRRRRSGARLGALRSRTPLPSSRSGTIGPAWPRSLHRLRPSTGDSSSYRMPGPPPLAGPGGGGGWTRSAASVAVLTDLGLLEQDGQRGTLRDGSVPPPCRDRDHVSLLEGHVGSPFLLDPEPALDAVEQLVLSPMDVPREGPVKLHDLHQKPPHLGHDRGLPRLGQTGSQPLHVLHVPSSTNGRAGKPPPAGPDPYFRPQWPLPATPRGAHGRERAPLLRLQPGGYSRATTVRSAAPGRRP